MLTSSHPKVQTIATDRTYLQYGASLPFSLNPACCELCLTSIVKCRSTCGVAFLQKG